MIYQFRLLKPQTLDDGVVYPVNTIIEVEMKYAAYDEFVEKYKDRLERYIGKAPAIVWDGVAYGTTTSDRASDGFKEVLAKIGEHHTASPLAERFRKNKTIKEIKTKETVKKHREKAAKATKEAISKRKSKMWDRP
jgi:hypothetical protein